MMSFRLTVRITLGAFAIALGACSAQHAMVPSSGPVQATHSWMDLRAKPKQILYVSDPFLGVVNLYDADRKDGRPIGQLGDFKQPEGLFVDSSKDIWVTDFGGRKVVGYREGSLFPFYEFGDTSGYPNSLCNGAYSPTFYVVNLESATGGNGQTIDVYVEGGKKPSSVLTDTNAANLLYCGVDGKGNLFVTMQNTSGSGEVDEFPKGKTTPVVVLNALSNPNGIVFDEHDYLVLSESGTGRIRTYAPPYGKGPKSSFSYDGAIVQIVLDSTATHIWGANQTLIVAQEFAYPDGAAENETQSEGLSHPTGIALSPPELH